MSVITEVPFYVQRCPFPACCAAHLGGDVKGVANGSWGVGRRMENVYGGGCGDCCHWSSGGDTMKQLWISLCLIGVWVGGIAWAQLPQIEDYRGDLWSRPALTGDWGGLRNTLAKQGINLDVDLVQSVLGLNTGGSFRNQDSVRYPYG